jgi:hypothetical protein
MLVRSEIERWLLSGRACMQCTTHVIAYAVRHLWYVHAGIPSTWHKLSMVLSLKHRSQLMRPIFHLPRRTVMHELVSSSCAAWVQRRHSAMNVWRLLFELDS